MRSDDPNHISVVTFIASFFGSILYAMANYYAVAYSPKQADDAAIKKAKIEGVFAVISGVIGGWYAAPALCEWWNIRDLQAVSLIGLLVGLLFWKLLPSMILAGVQWFQDKFGGKQST